MSNQFIFHLDILIALLDDHTGNVILDETANERYIELQKIDTSKNKENDADNLNNRFPPSSILKNKQLNTEFTRVL